MEKRRIIVDELADNTIRFEMQIPLQTDAVTVDASTAGAVDVVSERILVSEEMTTHLKEVYFEVSSEALPSGVGAEAQVYDVTSAVVLAALSFPSDGTERARNTSNFVGSLVAGHEIKVRANIISAVSGATFTWRSSRLILKYGIR